jgi:hypothetical protein
MIDKFRALLERHNDGRIPSKVGENTQASCLGSECCHKWRTVFEGCGIKLDRHDFVEPRGRCGSKDQVVFVPMPMSPVSQHRKSRERP